MREAFLDPEKTHLSFIVTVAVGHEEQYVPLMSPTEVKVVSEVRVARDLGMG